MSELEEYKAKQHRIFGEFLHEIKTPLAIMRSHLETEIVNEVLPLSTRTKLVQDVEEIARMNSLINDVKFLLDDNYNSMKMQFQNESLLELVMDVVEMLEPLAHEKNQQISLHCDEVFTLLVDKNRLKQLFVNLITNAIKYTPNEGLISVKFSSDIKTLKVSVQDNGIGISKEDQLSIFEAFYRVENSTQEGVGLGLALSSAICSVHNAKIEVQSTLHVGSTFSVIFKKSQ